MNDLGSALVWLVVQVTAVGLAGLGLTALAARRAPGAGASTALAALAATAVLAVLRPLNAQLDVLTASLKAGGMAGGDDFRFDLRASGDTPDAAAEMARHCEALVAVAKKTAADQEKTRAAASDKAEAAALRFFRKVLDRAAVHREGAVVTVHADVTSGLNELLSLSVKELTRGKKERD